MKLSTWLREATEILSKAKIATGRLDCLVLLEDFTGKDRSWLLSNPDFELNNAATLNAQVKQRSNHKPLAYIRGKSEFYGREFIVNDHTLEPRPETETMIDLLLGRVKSKKLKVESIIDVGTGSGCIAITAKLELPEATVIASDIDEKCIETATKNAKKLNANVKFYTGNLLEPLSNINNQLSNITIMANLPYVPDKYQLNEAAKFEPKHAIFGGADGLDLYRKLFNQLSTTNYELSTILTESLPFQHQELTNIAESAGYKLNRTDDFVQLFVPF